MNARRRCAWNAQEPSERVEEDPSTVARMPFTCEAHLIYVPDNISNLYTRLLISKMHLAAAAAYIGVMVVLWITILQGTTDHISQDKVRTSKRWPLDFSRGKPVSTPILYCGDAYPKGIYNTSSLLVEADDGYCDEVDTWSFAHLFIVYQLIPVALLYVRKDWNNIIVVALLCLLRFAWYTWTDEAVGAGVDASDHVLINGFIAWLSVVTAAQLWIVKDDKEIPRLLCIEITLPWLLPLLSGLYALFAVIVFPWSTYVTAKYFHTEEEMFAGLNSAFYVLLVFVGLVIYFDKRKPLGYEPLAGDNVKPDARLPIHY